MMAHTRLEQGGVWKSWKQHGGSLQTYRVCMLRGSVAYPIVRVPKPDRVVVASCNENDISRHVRKYKDTTILFKAHQALCRISKPSKSSTCEAIMSLMQTGDGHDAQKLERTTCSYENLSASFKFDKKRDFKAQYAHIYFARLMKMRDSLCTAAKHKWGK